MKKYEVKMPRYLPSLIGGVFFIWGIITSKVFMNVWEFWFGIIIAIIGLYILWS
jgi:hypothetical protein